MVTKQEVVDYGVNKKGKPRRVPIRLLSASESLIYWFVICVPLIWLVGPHLRPLLFDGGLWFDRSLIISIVGWVPFGLIGNGFIRVLNVGVLRTASRRPAGDKKTMTGVKKSKRVPRGYTPPDVKG